MEEIKLFDEALEGITGYFSNRERGRVISDAQIKETVDLIYRGVYRGKQLRPHEREFLIREALTTSDFPYLFGDVLQRQVLANYKAVDPVWKAFFKMSTVPRIYPQVGGYRFAITGGDQYLAEVAEKGEYLASERDEDRYALYVKKYGRQFDISWESLINDDLGALKDTPTRFAMAAVRTEHRLATNRYADDWGTHANGFLYETGVNTDNNTLTIGNLEIGLQTMAAFTDANSEPILNRARFLVVPPGLELTARQIITSATKQVAEGTGATVTMWPTANVVSQMGLQLIVDPYLPIMDGAHGTTAWYLFADPKDIAALEAGHLQGHERPEICMKASDKVTIGGGAIGPMSGDFATDNVLYRVRHIFGVVRLDWRATYAGGLS